MSRIAIIGTGGHARECLEAARAAGEEPSGEGAQNRGQRGGPPRGFGGGPSPENPLPTKEAFIVRPNLNSFFGPIFLLSIPIMIWSLTWVARKPGKHPSAAAGMGYGEQQTGAFS